MKKITIGFTVDHTFRNIYGKIVDLYKKYNIEEAALEASESNREFIPPELNLPINTSNLMNHIPFESVEAMNDFIFSEFCPEIFAYSKESEPGSIQVFNDWMINLPKNVEVLLVSNEVGRTKPSTLFFLSKTGFEGNNIKFITDNVDIWKLCDILVTSGDINIKLSKPKNKKLIIINKEHNKGLTGDMNFNSLFDFFTEDVSKIIKEFIPQNNNIIKKIKKCLNLGTK